MPFKQLSLQDLPRESIETSSARSGGSQEAKKEGVFSSNFAASNPFKQPPNLHKHKSLAVGGAYSATASNSAAGVPGSNPLGFKSPDASSPFAFQPLNNSQITFGATSTSMMSQSSFSSVAKMAQEEQTKQTGSPFPWDSAAKERFDKMSGGVSANYGEAALDHAVAHSTSQKKKQGPFKHSQK
eukprot:CAMPEP_0170452710 /NCGR_PEP_ID=MMETSP0123-20130129/1512_1 /TAXON_ID=182087 /ORGANISM="Favella ehrenbergii, Strain Fehren 1" /LENGTH=183 /DNA_ID=CAMNT_0010714795 /DNA_START=3228 /DNA_END=3779 /DNA_ORIENTATION=+